jgi:ATP-dependent exoDNAse (exonuclease V) beta subunit
MKNEIIQHPRNKAVVFNEAKHTYHVNGERFDGVTSWISSFCQPFDKQKVAKKMARIENKEVDEVLREWQDANSYGSYVHKTIEDYVNKGTYTPSAELDMFIATMKQYKLTPLYAEWVIYNEHIKRASPIDLVCIDDKGNVVIVDLKTMKKPISAKAYKNKKMVYPLQNLPDAKYYKQALQVGIYKYWVETLYNMSVSEVNYVLRLRDDVCEMIPMLDLTTEIIKIHE